MCGRRCTPVEDVSPGTEAVTNIECGHPGNVTHIYVIEAAAARFSWYGMVTRFVH
jgi:hypothetical protein